MKIKPFLYIILITTGVFSLSCCVDGDDYSIPPFPPEGFFKETFTHTTRIDGSPVSASPSWPKISDVTGFDNNSPVTYSDPSNRADIRFLNSISNGTLFVWIPYDNGTPASFVMNNLPTEGKTNITLRYKFNNGGVYNEGSSSNANVLTLKCNDEIVTIPSIEITPLNGANKFIVVKMLIPDGTTKIEFTNLTRNGFRIDDIELIENYSY